MASISSGVDPRLRMKLPNEILGILGCNIMYLLFVDYNLFRTSKRFADHIFGNLKLHVMY